MNTAEWDQSHAAIRDQLDNLVTWATGRGDLRTTITTLQVTGKIARTVRATAWPLLLAEAVIRLAMAKQADR